MNNFILYSLFTLINIACLKSDECTALNVSKRRKSEAKRGSRKVSNENALWSVWSDERVGRVRRCHPDTLIILKYIMIKAIDAYIQSTLASYFFRSDYVRRVSHFSRCYYLLWKDDGRWRCRRMSTYIVREKTTEKIQGRVGLALRCFYKPNPAR